VSQPPRTPYFLHQKILVLALAAALGGGCAAKEADDGPSPPVGADASVVDAPAGDAPMGVQPDLADTNAPAPASVTEGPYSACRDFEASSPTSGCICANPNYGSTVCLPECKVDTDCPAPPPGGPAVRCMEATGGLFRYCVMLCQADAGAPVCPTGYTCSGYRTNIGPFCAVPGSDISDLSSRYDGMPFDNQHPATAIGPAQRLCGAPVVLSGELTTGDLNLPRAVRTRTGCTAAPPGYVYLQDVYTVELVGPGPHRLELDSCGHAPYRMSVMLFQRPGSSTPYDTSSVCRNLIGFADPSARRDCAGGVSARFVGLQPGSVQVVVSSEGTGVGPYQLTVKSETSRCP
jgi:hypothetical protein